MPSGPGDKFDYFLSRRGSASAIAREVCEVLAAKGYSVFVPEDCCSTMNAEWHNASINFALQNVAVVTNADAVVAALG